jgi:hypothetical protein
MALSCSFCGVPVGAVRPLNSPVSCCRECCLTCLPEVLAEGLLTGGSHFPTPQQFAGDFAEFMGGLHKATKAALGRLVPADRN